jgi:hypothetical protein
MLVRKAEQHCDFPLIFRPLFKINLTLILKLKPLGNSTITQTGAQIYHNLIIPGYE